jgi:lipoprotein-releasing system permease protein
VRDTDAGLLQQVMAMAGDRSAGAVLRGVRPEELLSRGAFLNQTSGEALTAFQRGEGVIIGERLAEDLDLKPGDPLTLVSPEGRRTVIGTVPRIKTYPMLGVFSIGIYDLDSSIVFVPIDQAARFAGVNAEATTIDVFINDPDQSWTLRGEILRALGDGYQVTDFQRLNAGFFATVQTQRNVIFLILTMIILVAALNIISGQIMLVRDKGAEIGILRTMGAKRGAILRIFLLSGASIGFVGTAAGLVVGLSFAANIEAIRRWFEGWMGIELFSREVYYLTEMPSDIEPLHVVFICAIALGLSLAATLYPAWRAARLDPVEALRYE